MPARNKAVKKSHGMRFSYKEEAKHVEAFWADEEIKKLEEKIASGTFSIWDRYRLLCLKGDQKILNNLANKVLADKTDITSLGKEIGVPILANLINVSSNNSDKENTGIEKKD